MSHVSITCPHCHQHLSLTDALVGEAVQERLRSEKLTLEKSIESGLRLRLEAEMRDQQERLKAESRRTDELAAIEKDLRAKLRDAETKARDAEVEAARRFDESRTKLAEEASQRATAELQLKLSERDHQMEAMRRQIEDLSRKAEQGSQQLQGEVLEIAIEREIQALFPSDQVEAVASGARGADIIQTVQLRPGLDAGRVVWEVKRTKHWKNDWIAKIKGDCLAAQADVAVLVTQAMPAGSKAIEFIEGVLVCNYECWAAVAHLVRRNILNMCEVRLANEGLEGKAGRVYEHITGPRFKQQIEILVAAHVALKDQLEKEKRAITRAWAERDRLLTDALATTAVLYGDVGGIVGASLPQVAELALLEEG